MRLIVAFIICIVAAVSPAMAAAFNCTLDAACTVASPCAWDALGNWNDDGLCNGTYPANGGGNTYTATIGSGRAVIIKTDAMTIGTAAAATPAITLTGGTLIFSNDTANGIGSEGFRTTTLVPGSGGAAITMNSTSTLDMPVPNRLLCTNSSTDCLLDLDGTVNIYGTVVDATITSVAAATTNALCDGGTESEYIAVTVDKGQDNAIVGRRIMFYDGPFKNRHFEIVSVAAKVIGFCTYLPDAAPATDLTCDTGTIGQSCGQRLTPHVTFGKFPNTTPTAGARHWTPWPAPGNAICAGAFDPVAGCTAANTGTLFSISPVAGNRIAIINDVWVGGTAEDQKVGFSMTNSDKMPLIFAANIFGVNEINISASGPGAETTNDILYNNIHDFLETGGALAVTGFKDFNIRYNTVHDDGGATVSGYASMSVGCLSQTSEPCPDNVEITDNHLYRSVGNQIEVSSGPTIKITRDVKVLRNLIHEGCHAVDANECGGIEVDACQGCQIRNNVVFDMQTTDDANGSTVKLGDGFRAPASGSVPCNSMEGTDISFNWMVNLGHHGVSLAATNGCAGNGVGITHNYIAATGEELVWGGNLYSNVLRNGSLIQVADSATQVITSMRGNFIIGNEAENSTVCAIQGGCTYSAGVFRYDSTYFTQNPTLVAEDNVFMRTQYPGAAFYVEGALDTTMTVSHNTMMSTLSGIDMSTWAPTVSSTISIDNNAFSHFNAGNFALCSADAQAVDNMGTYARVTSPTTTENTATFNGTCSNTGTAVQPYGGLKYRNPAVYDFNLSRFSPLYGAGSDGDSIGIRAFLFDRDAIDDIWGDALPWDGSVGGAVTGTVPTTTKPFPRNICDNGTSCVDTDGDGVLNIHDNRDGVFNPSQCIDINIGEGYTCRR